MLERMLEDEAENGQHQGLDPVLHYPTTQIQNSKKITSIGEKLGTHQRQCMNTKILTTTENIQKKFANHQLKT